MSMAHTNAIPLLDRFARFWSGCANDQRATYHRFIGGTPLAEDVELEEITRDGVPGWWVLPQRHRER
jgi:hypothetical protein